MSGGVAMTQQSPDTASLFSETCSALEDALTEAYKGQASGLADEEIAEIKAVTLHKLALATGWLTAIPIAPRHLTPHGLLDDLIAPAGLAPGEILRAIGWSPRVVRALLQALMDEGYQLVRYRHRGLGHVRYRLMKR